MSEEEKKAIEELKKQYRLSTNVDCITTDIRNEYARTILNLIEQLQKENEKLKNEKEPAGEFFMSKNGIVIKVIDNREEKKKVKELGWLEE